MSATFVGNSTEPALLDKLRESVPLSDGMFFSVFVFVWHLSIFFAFTAAYMLISRIHLFDKYRLRPAKPQDERLTRATCLNILLSQVVAVPYLRYIVWPVFAWGSNMGMSGPMPGWGVVASQIFISMLLEDTLFYWVHRLMHHRLLYKTIHKQHHEYKDTVSYATEYATATEQTIANIIPSYAGPFLLNMHLGTLAVWLFVRLWETYDAHSGYVFPWSPWNMLLSVQGGTARHDFHHSQNAGSFGSFFKFWDWAMGTDRQFKAHMEKQQHERQQQAAGLAAEGKSK